MSSRWPDAPRTLWLGAAGTATAFGVLRSIQEHWPERVRVVAADINPAHLIPASVVADSYEQVPAVADPAFTERLTDGLRRHGVDTYFPILDREIVLAAELLERGELSEITLIAPAADAARMCLDKLETVRVLAAAGLPTPKTTRIAEASWADGAVLVKPRAGVGSVGVRVVDAPEALAVAAATGDDLIAQEFCRGPEITIDAFRSRDGHLSRALCRERLETKAGVSTKARIFEDDELADLAAQVAIALDLVGTYCFQVMRSISSDEWRITDVNPRPGAGTRMSAAVGVDFNAAVVADAWSIDPRPFLQRLDAERYVARQYVEYVL